MGRIVKVSGPVVEVEIEKGEKPFLFKVARVGNLSLTGEVVSIAKGRATVQVYERTEGLKVGERVSFDGKMLSIILGPGILGKILDGLGRVLPFSGERIERGRGRRFFPEGEFEFKAKVNAGEWVKEGQILGFVELKGFNYKILSPVAAEVKEIKSGRVSPKEPVARVGNREVFVFEERAVRIPSSFKNRVEVKEPLLTGQRIIDFLFPIAKGGSASIPGGFGTGKTVLQQTLAKWCNADVIVYIGCGERGNEMTEILKEFPKLKDPYTGRSLMERTVLIANTSDMPVSARESSIYLGITVAEYFKDMGYSVAVMADSTSRWAEAMREISGRMGELPIEEGFPASLSSKIASIYERAGAFLRGSVTIIGAVSPPGGDFSEPVTRHTKRFTGAFWALDRELASSRFYPAVNPFNSYSRYAQFIKDWWNRLGDYESLRNWMVETLQEGERLEKLVKLLGRESLPEDQKLKYEEFNLIKEAFLRQNAFDPVDCYSSPKKQILMAEVLRKVSNWWHKVFKKRGIPVDKIVSQPVISKVLKMKMEVDEEHLEEFEELKREIAEVYEEFLR
ncbi:V/A-type H+-transporting ATPase subunit A [Thermovibrio guaymasensis]|uniref:V/A-type H+-transporting ATPase subunit A n=1 Tax=Thermovibrio guaymasensis TaxID=240167 RepID=A0A420W770_9BACT|nr:V-type ATP synthase subunit A [Thermovibrio guaymasensis]RKQ61877.1 V/A-type H+-transporting ATPase subunit A [Thermovibrio guaymasensis]